MRIHTSLTEWQMREVLKRAGTPAYAEVLEKHGSRTHSHAFEVVLSGSSTTASQWGNRDVPAATWDEWGAFLGSLYDADPDARCGSNAKRPTYRDAEHFHFLTGDRFRARFDLEGECYYLPTDTHPRHHWDYVAGDGFRCTKCSAYRPTWQQADAYAPRNHA